MASPNAESKQVFLNRNDIKFDEVKVLQKGDDNMTEPGPPPPPPQGYKTLVKLYVRRTGREVGVFSGTNCEIKGWCNLDNSQMSVGIDLPEKTDFSGQNGGNGLLVAQKELVTTVKPATISLGLYEEGGTGVDNRQFVNFFVDFARLTPEIRSYYDGNVRTTRMNYAGFEGTVWWQLQGAN